MKINFLIKISIEKNCKTIKSHLSMENIPAALLIQLSLDSVLLLAACIDIYQKIFG